jgi:hypothetical protein
MFGNFLQNFGLDFQLPDQNPQSGLFGSNAPQAGELPLGGPAAPGGAGTGLNMHPPASNATPSPAGIINPPPAATNPAGNGAAQPSPSPLASPLAQGQTNGAGLLQLPPTDNPAPAAGVGSQFNGMKQNA